MTSRRALVLAGAAALAACGDGGAPARPAVPAAPAAVARGTDADLFRDVTASTGIDFVHVLADGVMDTLPESVGAGVTCLDFDRDGRLDLFFVAQGWNSGISSNERVKGLTRHRLYRNLSGLRFEDVTEKAGLDLEEFGMSAIAADFDDDGWTDLYVAVEGANHLYRNRGDGTFDNVTGEARCGGNACSATAAAFDADGDGDLDLYVGNYVDFDRAYKLAYQPDVFPGPLAFSAQPDVLYLNEGGGRFRDATAGSGIDAPPPARAMGVTVLDYDADGRPDLFVANDATPNFLFRNLGGGRFREVAAEAGAAYGVQGDAAASMAGMLGDVDEDGRDDLHVTNLSFGSLLLATGTGFTDRILRSGIPGPSAQSPSWGGGLFDADLDGHLDLFVAHGDGHRATGRRDLYFRGRGDGTFEDASAGAGAWFLEERCGRGAMVADLDDDGRLDVVVTHVLGRPAVLRNQTPLGPAAHWTSVALRARPGNASGQGARVTVRAGGRERTQTAWPRYGYLTQGDPRLHFGLGAADRIERLTVTWPDGTRQEAADLPADRVLTVEQGGSVQ